MVIEYFFGKNKWVHARWERGEPATVYLVTTAYPNECVWIVPNTEEID